MGDEQPRCVRSETREGQADGRGRMTLVGAAYAVESGRVCLLA
jgi:hypothetical protein